MKRVLLAVACLLPMGGDWPQFRGPKGDGVTDAVGLPTTWSDTENLKWKAGLPGRGLSCPVVAKGKVFLTCSDGMNDTRLHAVAIDAESGKQLWARQFWSTGQTSCHPKTCMACPTPVTDGDNVYCLFATNDLVALTADGNVKWIRSFPTEYPRMINHVGRSSSPVLFRDVLILQMENQGESFVCGVDTATGKTKWSVPRATDNSWNTPALFTHGGQTDLLVASAEGMAAIDPATGSVRWKFEDEKFNPIASLLVKDNDIVYSPSFAGMVAIKAAAGDAPSVVWKSPKMGGFSTASSVVHGGKIYAITARDAVLSCGNVDDGKVLWTLRVKGPFSASPFLSEGKLYLANETGLFQIIDVTGAEGKLIGTVQVAEFGNEPDKVTETNRLLATPAIANNKIYFRTNKHLYCVGK